MSNDFKFLMFAGRLFHSLGAATEYNVPAERSALYKGTTSLSGVFVDSDRVHVCPIVAGFRIRSERYPGVPERRALNVAINNLYFILDVTSS